MSKKKHQVDAEQVFLPLVLLFALQGRPYGGPAAPFYGSRFGSGFGPMNGIQPGYGPYARPWPYRTW